MLRAVLGVFLLASALSGGGPARAQEAVDLLLVLAADGSGSIDEAEFKLQRQGYADALTDQRVLDAITSGYRRAIAVSLLEWGAPDSQPVIVDWRVIRDRASAEAFAAELLAAPRQAYGYNSISGAIDKARALIRSSPYRAEQKVIDVSGDGPNIGGRPVQDARDEAVLAGITINALVVVSPGGGVRGPFGMPLAEHYERDVIGGAGAFVMSADKGPRFKDALLQKLVREIAGTASAGPSVAER